MNRLPALKPRQLVAALKAAGFEEHTPNRRILLLVHPDGRRIVVHSCSRFTARDELALIRQSGLTEEQFRAFLSN